ncbi:uncharacterized protein LOC141674619 [Apium graveolens]|uniref:uncharacterized protein LOC141674619 n=1 Tax=Apium graveolens TaxID=4045 RepID=UPI003D7B18F3
MVNFINTFDLNLPGNEEETPINVHEQVQVPTQACQEGSLNHRRIFDLNIGEEGYQDSLNEDIFDEELVQLGQRNLAIIDLNQTPPSEEDELQSGRTSSRRRILSNDERRLIHLALLKRSVNGKLRKGSRTEVSQLFYVSTKTISRIWKQAKISAMYGKVDISHRKMKNYGRKRVEIDLEQFQKVPLSRRTSIRSSTCAMNVSKSSLHRNFKHGKIRRNTNPIKPLLKESNKKVRVEFCLSMIRNRIGDDPKFSDMFNVIHIDEKWFYITKNCEKFYLMSGEHDPDRACKSKNFLTKVMFLEAMARPRFDSDRNETFSGNIGIFPFITKQPAKRSSVNMSAGTLETKAITSVGKDLSRSYLIHKVLPTILEKWPAGDRNITITIQQDNARTHVDPNDEEFRLAVSRYGLNVQIRCQPPNYPDLNILDLGFFNAIQSLHQKDPARIVDDLVIAVKKAFDIYPSIKSNRIFLTLQQCMIQIMKYRGANNYKIPHMNMKALERKRKLPLQLRCTPKLIEDVTDGSMGPKIVKDNDQSLRGMFN